MSIVFAVVTRVHYEHTELQGIYSTREKAEIASRHAKPQTAWRPEIYEVELDAAPRPTSEAA